MIILKALVGSRAHGLHNEDSDWDWRGVFVTPTSEILSLGFKYSPTSWIEGKVDDTSYEIGHFLMLCTKANPSVLEVLMAKECKVNTSCANKLRDLFPFMYNPQDAFNAFTGYAKNQQKKLLDNHLQRRGKFAVAYIRTLQNLVQLFQEGYFNLEVEDKERFKAIREWSNGEIIDEADRLIGMATDLLPKVENHQDLKRVNEFLLEVRKGYWDE